jgi:hypothetical protein
MSAIGKSGRDGGHRVSVANDPSRHFAAPNNNVAVGVTTELIGAGPEFIGRE